MNNEKKIDVSYYENNDLSEMMKKNKDKWKIIKKPARRVTMNISLDTYTDAHEIDTIMNMGYQNVLKTAMVLGLKELHRQIDRKKTL